jgi:hypothetical protein
MKAFLLIAAIVFSLFLALPLVQMTTGWPPDVPLLGVETSARFPALSPSGWWSGELQSGFDEWLSQRIGFRGVLVRTANQVQFSLFGELPGRRGTQVVQGQDGFLFENAYVRAYREGGNRPGRELDLVSASTRKMQDYLAADGVALLLVIAPSKAEIYPDKLPDDADTAGRPERRSNYQNLIERLHADGVNVVDAHELFRSLRRDPGTPLLFGKGGTHWNQYGSALVVEQIMKRLRELTGRDLPSFEVTGSVTNRTILGVDNDLAGLLNLWSGERMAGPQIHPVVETRAGSHRPDILFIGDSFVFTLTDWMDREGLYRRRDTYYYYNRQFAYPGEIDAPLDKRSMDLLADVRRRDAVVIEVNEYWLPRIGFGFVRDLLKAYILEERARDED